MDIHSSPLQLGPAVPKVLIVDDEQPVREFLAEALSPECEVVHCTDSLHGVLQAADTDPFDLLIADICMPGATGLDLLALVQQLHWDCAVILISGHADLDQVVAGIRLHAADFLLKPFSVDTLVHSVRKCFDKLRVARQRRSERDVLTAGLRARTEQLEVAQNLLSNSYRSALEVLIATLEAREKETYAHSFRVRAYALHLAELTNYPAADLPLLTHAALLHDVGKVAVPDAILLKPGPLDANEFEVLKSHAAVGERIVNRMGFLTGAGDIIRHHHERWDGRGYPDGISGAEIPLGSRLFAVADTLDAMTSNRCYRGALTVMDARDEIRRCAGTQFDPDIAQAVLDLGPEIWMELRHQADRDANTAIIPDIVVGKGGVCGASPVQSFHATARG